MSAAARVRDRLDQLVDRSSESVAGLRSATFKPAAALGRAFLASVARWATATDAEGQVAAGKRPCRGVLPIQSLVFALNYHGGCRVTEIRNSPMLHKTILVGPWQGLSHVWRSSDCPGFSCAGRWRRLAELRTG